VVDRDLIIAKAGSVRRHLKRVEEKRSQDVQDFLKDFDCQDIVSFNLQLAIQNSIDIAAHIISEEGMGVPGSFTEMFYLLEENGYLSKELTEKMVRAVGFRNLLVHEYGKIDLKQVHQIANEHIQDLNKYLLSIFAKLGIS
jgi:uncharacterized protein YutE (UPF0331/DUF86 family)